MTQKRHNRYWLCGLLYGLTLMFWSFGAAGVGHGTYVPLGLLSSPLGWLGIPVAFFGLPVLWAGVGFLLGQAHERGMRLTFILIVAAHYLSIPLLLTGETFGDWDYFNKLRSSDPVGTLGMLVTYLAGQAVMWVAYFRVKSSVD